VNRRPRWLVIAATLAVAIEAIGVVGWWSWRRVVATLGEDPAAGALMLAEAASLQLPSAVWRSRRFPARELGKAPDDLVVPALLAVSRGQQTWAPSDPNGWVNRARADLVGGFLDDASEAIEGAILRSPTSPELHWLAALTARARGRNAEALDHLATVEGLGSRDGPINMELLPEEADWVRLEGLERRLEYYPRQRSRGVIALAAELRKRGETDLGRRTLDEVGDDPLVVLELARWDLEDGRTADAERRLAELADRGGLPAKLLAETWAVRAAVRDRAGDPEGAKTAAETAVAYDPRSAGPYQVLARLAERRGDVDSSLGYLRRAWGMNPTDIGLLMAVARTAEKASRFDDARIALERATTVDPSNPNLQASLVEFHLRRGDFMDATVALSDALDRFPTDPKLLRLADRLLAEVSRR
jgi:Tfp pilus assembly protein PilF